MLPRRKLQPGKSCSPQRKARALLLAGLNGGTGAWGEWLGLLRTQLMETATKDQLAPTVRKESTRERPGLGRRDGEGGAMGPSSGSGTCAFGKAGAAHVL